MGTAYHPQTDGQTERVNQCIEGYLRCMLFNQTKNWYKWLPLAEFWYNTNYHSSLKTTPFQALYGYSPPQLPLGSPPRSAVEGVNEMMKERHIWINELKAQLKKAQDRMKRFADGKRSERKFRVGDWVYLKLQPYRQLTVQRRANQKLAPRFYGPFEIISKIGEVAYELKLPPNTQIHPVFHVSQLKARVGDGQVVEPEIPLVHPQHNSNENPEGILGRRMLKKNNEAIPQVLIKWENQDEEDASWEDYEEIRKKFPQFILRDKDNFEREGVLRKNQSGLLAV